MDREKIMRLYFIILLLTMSVSLNLANPIKNDKSLEAGFNKAYKAWKHYIKEFNPKKTSIEYRVYNKYYANIIRLGVPVLPLIVKKLRKGEYLLNHSFLKISKLKEREIELFFLYAYKNTKNTTLVILRWWDYKRTRLCS